MTHHDQLQKEVCLIEPMKSKVQPAAEYWTDDVKMKSKVQPAADYWTVDRETQERRCVIFGEQKNKELIFSFKSLKIFWINNSASVDNTLLELKNS